METVTGSQAIQPGKPEHRALELGFLPCHRPHMGERAPGRGAMSRLHLVQKKEQGRTLVWPFDDGTDRATQADFNNSVFLTPRRLTLQSPPFWALGIFLAVTYTKNHQAQSSRPKCLNLSIHCLQSTVKIKNLRGYYFGRQRDPKCNSTFS